MYLYNTFYYTEVEDEPNFNPFINLGNCKQLFYKNDKILRQRIVSQHFFNLLLKQYHWFWNNVQNIVANILTHYHIIFLTCSSGAKTKLIEGDIAIPVRTLYSMYYISV